MGQALRIEDYIPRFVPAPPPVLEEQSESGSELEQMGERLERQYERAFRDADRLRAHQVRVAQGIEAFLAALQRDPPESIDDVVQQIRRMESETVENWSVFANALRSPRVAKAPRSAELYRRLKDSASEVITALQDARLRAIVIHDEVSPQPVSASFGPGDDLDEYLDAL